MNVLLDTFAEKSGFSALAYNFSDLIKMPKHKPRVLRDYNGSLAGDYWRLFGELDTRVGLDLNALRKMIEQPKCSRFFGSTATAVHVRLGDFFRGDASYMADSAPFSAATLARALEPLRPVTVFAGLPNNRFLERSRR